VPLKILTLGIWSYLIPLHYPCIATVPGEEPERQIALQSVLKRGAHAMGGNLVILVASGDTLVVTATEHQVSAQTVQMTTLRAFVIKEDKTAPTNPPTDASAAGKAAPQPSEAAAPQ